MKKQKGGLKLKDLSKKGFKAVYDMINSPSGSLNLLTYKSLKGFMIFLNVSASDSEYLALNGTQFTKPVTSFILKFAVITPNNDEALPDYKGIEKSSESKESYFEEAKLQQNIWKSSISGGRPEICPPVANFCLFNNDNSKGLLQFLQGKTTGDVKDIFDYLFNCVNTNSQNGIGVIIMPKVEMSETFGDFARLPKGSDFNGITVNVESINDAFASVSAQIARLFIDIGVIHFDLHDGNALIYKSDDNKIKCLLIDFGRASNILNNTDDDYLTAAEKQPIAQKKTEFFDALFKIPEDAPDGDKRRFLLSVVDYVADKDFTINQQKFGFTDKERYQMDWYRYYPRRTFVPVMAFNILKSSIPSEGTKMLPATIKRYESQGYLINFSGNVDSFVVPFDKPASPVCDEEMQYMGMCSIMGGKRRYKTRKIKKTKKLKKNRKSRKSRT